MMMIITIDQSYTAPFSNLWVRHGLLDDDDNNDRSVLHSTILKPMGEAWVDR